MDKETLDRIRMSAAFAVEKLGGGAGFPFGYNRESVQWLEGFIERQRVRGVDHGNLVSVLGSFLGEAIIAEAGGEWTKSDDGIGIAFQVGDSASVCFPYAKVAKQFENGVAGGDGVASFYDFSVNVVAKGKLE
ncbi:MAG: hypothetical protein KA153_10790 [Hyphomonadaceae bacterium]|jgi:hypothetical protein|nr:hypothetical protein [Caulobacteraceae bacterium]MBP6690469.1 hypothetical protein [Hyphomonadaceae bacterium]